MKKILNKEIIAGVFFLMGIVAIIIFVFLLGSKTGLGEAKYYREVVFGDVGGLRIGAPVRVSGVNVGTVIGIDFIDNPNYPDKRVKVTLSILSKFKPEVEKCSLFAIKTEGLLGDKLIDIQLPRKDEICILPKEEELIMGQDPLDIRNLADDFSETTRYFIYLSKKMTDLLEELNKVTITSKRVLDRIEDRLIEGGLMNLLMGEEKK